MLDKPRYLEMIESIIDDVSMLSQSHTVPYCPILSQCHTLSQMFLDNSVQISSLQNYSSLLDNSLQASSLQNSSLQDSSLQDTAFKTAAFKTAGQSLT